MRLKGPIIFILFAALTACGPTTSKKPAFLFEQDDKGLSLSENGSPVFYYRKEPKTLTGEYVCNHYIHPLYALNGDTLTEEFPPDHPYHRGIFWSWHQFYVDTLSLGDDWVMENISHVVSSLHASTEKGTASLDLEVLWSSALLENGKDFLMEKTRITVHPLKTGIRTIDFEISLGALIPGVRMGGSDDEKGYGGFCARLKLPEDLAFTSVNGPVIPQTTQVIAGPWMNFSGTFGPSDKESSLAILCHPSTPNYPAPWILRQQTSMQNIVFPGRDRVELSMEQPIVLRYRLLIHEGSAQELDLTAMQSAYENLVY